MVRDGTGQDAKYYAIVYSSCSGPVAMSSPCNMLPSRPIPRRQKVPAEGYVTDIPSADNATTILGQDTPRRRGIIRGTSQGCSISRRSSTSFAVPLFRNRHQEPPRARWRPTDSPFRTRQI